MIDKRDTLKLDDIRRSEKKFSFPVVASEKISSEDIESAISACPTGALIRDNKRVKLNLSTCIRCGECKDACSEGTIEMTLESGVTFRDRSEMLVDFC